MSRDPTNAADSDKSSGAGILKSDGQAIAQSRHHNATAEEIEMATTGITNDHGAGSGLPAYGATEGEPVSAEFIRDFGNRWEAGWNSHDTDQILAMLHPDIRWNDTVFWPEVIYGHAAMRLYIEKIWAVMPDVHFREVQLFPAPADGRALYLFEQTASAPPSTGVQKKATTYGCDIFLGFRDGLLSDYMAQYELAEMMRQFEMLPPRGGRIGGAYLLSLLGSRSDQR